MKYLSECFRQMISRTAASAQAIVLVSLIFLSLFITSATPAYAQGATPTPRAIVEYALTLEKLEADFYIRAEKAFESGGLVSLPQPAKKAIKSYGDDEAQHVADLSTVLIALGGNPNAVTIPDNPNYSAILGRNPFANPTDFLLALQYVEDLGVAAYKGQVRNLLEAGDAGETVLAGALEIHTVEARHAAGIRYLRQTLFGANVRPWIRNSSEVIYDENRSKYAIGSIIPFPSEAFDGFARMGEVLELVKPILNP